MSKGEFLRVDQVNALWGASKVKSLAKGLEIEERAEKRFRKVFQSIGALWSTCTLNREAFPV